MTVFISLAGLLFVILGANALVNGASAIAKRFNVPDLVIGLTIVAIGTSTPELAVSVVSAINGNTDIAIGNIVGSNIVNILLILGLSAIVFPLTIQKDTQYKEIPLVILAILLIGVCGNDIILDHGPVNILTRIDGIVLLCFFIIFMYYSFHIARKEDVLNEEVKSRPLWISTVLIIGGIAGLYFGGKYFVEGAVKIAAYMGMSEAMIGLTIVAIGTSLPELATSVVAAYKRNSDIAIGNVVGSNIINVFLILGLTATIRPLPLNPSANIDLAVALLASFLLFLSTFVLHKRVLVRSEGIIFISIYIVYIVYLINIQ